MASFPTFLLLPLLLFHQALSLTPLEEQQLLHFQQYLRIPTAHPSPEYHTAISFLSSLASSLNLPPSRTLHLDPSKSKPTFLLTLRGSSPSLPSVLLTSHLDSVPADSSHWSHPPFSAVLDPLGRIFARGSQDDKCLAVQHLHALSSLLSRGFQPLRSVHVSVVPDEEVGGADGMARLVSSSEFDDLNIGFVLDEGQASPSDEFRVFYADRTPWSVVITARGEPGHGARMYEPSAMENLMDAAEAAARFKEEQFAKVKSGEKAASEVISVNAVYMKAGTPSPPLGFVMNMQPSEGEMGLDVRIPPTADPDEVRRRIAEWAPSIKNMSYRIIEKGPIRDIVGRPLATNIDESNMWWVAFKEAVVAAGGKLAKPEILSSTTDARFMRQKGIPTLGFSPMANTPILLHEHDEFLQDTVFLKGIKVFEHVIQALSSLPDTSSATWKS